ncbi:MAG: ATP-binding cassette domain-containing protein [Fimbriimonadales bacterium]
MIRVSKLTQRFGVAEVLTDINLNIEKGERVCVMGSSGGGKTTLLRCMSGLLRPTEGSVELFGSEFYSLGQHDQQEIRKKIGVVFQGSALFDYLNVRNNVVFGIQRHRKLSNRECDEIADARLSVVGLKDAASKMPAELSGGMKKRVGLARALASEPELLFYDEPTAGLDPVTAYSIDALIKDVNENLHTTSVVVTHELSSVMRIASRVLFLSEGRIIADDVPEEFSKTKIAEIRELLDRANAKEIIES